MTDRSSVRRALAALAAGAAVAVLPGCAQPSTSAASEAGAGTATTASTSAGATSAPTEPVPGRATSPAGPPSSSLPPAAPSAGEPGPAPAAGSARAALLGLPVKGRAPRTGYERELFGPGWGDPDRNGCDTRNDVLARDLTGPSFRPGTRDCVVASGTLADPYSGDTIAFRRGQDTSDDVQIDHVVAVSDAWQKGAQAWDAGRRVAFYNDPLNLLAVDGPLNSQKGDGDAATWLPPDRGYRCAYVARQVAVKQAYGLWVTAAERDAMGRVLSACPDQPLPGAQAAARPPVAPAPSRATTSEGPGTTPAQAGTPFENCSAARAAGAAPVRRGDPGYGTHLDGDGDGVACE